MPRVDFSFVDSPLRESIVKRLPQIIQLYQSNNWWGSSPENVMMVERIIKGSHCFLLAASAGNIIGMGRAISDKASDAYIQDLTVAVDYRGAGIGRQILRRIVNKLTSDGIEWIGLIAEKDSHPFYEKEGFCLMKRAMPMLRASNDF